MRRLTSAGASRCAERGLPSMSSSTSTSWWMKSPWGSGRGSGSGKRTVLSRAKLRRKRARARASLRMSSCPIMSVENSSTLSDRLNQTMEGRMYSSEDTTARASSTSASICLRTRGWTTFTATSRPSTSLPRYTCAMAPLPMGTSCTSSSASRRSHDPASCRRASLQGTSREPVPVWRSRRPLHTAAGKRSLRVAAHCANLTLQGPARLAQALRSPHHHLRALSPHSSSPAVSAAGA
mmetsp:Transcript_1341/g.4593  ORF Transcript_1341/g.4593 Transcript_1341/m.4593 type:complete len:237 (-) Transcript_1341:121-831(-)